MPADEVNPVDFLEALTHNTKVTMSHNAKTNSVSNLAKQISVLTDILCHIHIGIKETIA